MSRNLVTSTAVSRLNVISTNRNKLLKKQREASQADTQLNTEYNDLQRKWEMNNKLIKMILNLKRK
jgi:hypothetical protein